MWLFVIVVAISRQQNFVFNFCGSGYPENLPPMEISLSMVDPNPKYQTSWATYHEGRERERGKREREGGREREKERYIMTYPTLL